MLSRSEASNNQANSKGPSNKKTIGSYFLGRTIGEGTFGKVKFGTHILTSEKVAIKILEKDRICDVSDVERVSREIHILKLIRHPNIIQLYEIIETPKKLYLIMEYASGGELFDYIVSHTRINEKEAIKFYQQLIGGIEYIHRLGIVHRDLKPENLLLDHNKCIKIVDFGLSNTYKEGELLKTACGSPCYAAPEMIAGKKYHGSRVDIWSSGVILFAMLCGYLPFEDPNTSQLYKKILAGDYQVPKFLSSNAKDLLQNILNTDPEKRFTVNQIREHPWLSHSKVESLPGILVGYDYIPVDTNILKQLEEFGYDIEHAKKCIEANKHNNITTAYYLLLKKHLQNGGESIADVSKLTEDFNRTNVKITRQIFGFNMNLAQTPHPPIYRMSERRDPRRRKFIETAARRTGSTGGSSSNEKEIKVLISNHIRNASHQPGIKASPKNRNSNTSASPQGKGNPRSKYLRYKPAGLKDTTPRPPSRVTPSHRRGVSRRGRTPLSESMDNSNHLNASLRLSPRFNNDKRKKLQETLMV